MKERPILFSDPMIKAILEGRKTMTRRVIKPQPVKNGAFWELYGAGWSEDNGSIPCVPGHSLAIRNPYGQPGDRLWVRETWATGEVLNKYSPVEIEDQCRAAGYKTGACADLWYRAGGYKKGACKHYFGLKGKWRPSIHMPRWASRITLEIINIRVERLQDMTAEDAIKEGMDDPIVWLPLGDPRIPQRRLQGYINKFILLWDRLYFVKGYGWDKNPWVWVIEFRRI